ncbi:hypothetical protein BofuT4_uP014490.1 [Botrytis cinerea T4]|uniref:Secreted protein n=1 Tax=Botryotinia fuckeliana (strain T4) TaxID=999810 RepID=G2XN65_BOTF4|nr:hypothetical protein BofuT4_uP014490.1 [Botrytis cinerea T4]
MVPWQISLLFLSCALMGPCLHTRIAAVNGLTSHNLSFIIRIRRTARGNLIKATNDRDEKRILKCSNIDPLEF